MSIRGIPDDYRPSLDELRASIGHLFMRGSGGLGCGPSAQPHIVIWALDQVSASITPVAGRAARLARDLRCSLYVRDERWNSVSWSAVMINICGEMAPFAGFDFDFIQNTENTCPFERLRDEVRVAIADGRAEDLVEMMASAMRTVADKHGIGGQA